jgi:hypothetical protein
MSNATATILLLALLTTITTTARSDECFCLSNADGAILRGCEAKGATFLCTDPETLKKSVQKITSDWRRIEAGADRCVVCRPAPRGTAGELPRGDEDAKKQQ